MVGNTGQINMPVVKGGSGETFSPRTRSTVSISQWSGCQNKSELVNWLISELAAWPLSTNSPIRQYTNQLMFRPEDIQGIFKI